MQPQLFSFELSPGWKQGVAVLSCLTLLTMSGMGWSGERR
jgi:hypothetical protein